MRYVLTVALCVAVMGLPVLAAAQAPAPSAPDVVRFTSWLTGEFDNFRQVSEQKENKVAEPHARLHTAIAPVSVPALGSLVFAVRESRPNAPETIAGVHVYRVLADAGTITAQAYAFDDAPALVAALNGPEKPTALPLDRLRRVVGCDVTWNAVADTFVGAQAPGRCLMTPIEPGARAVRAHNYRLTSEGLEITEHTVDGRGTPESVRPDGQPFLLRRARTFVCWAALRKAGSTDQYDGWRNLDVHDQGKWVAVPPEAGRTAPFAFELSQLRYGQQLPVMKLAIYEAGKEQAVAYTWTEPSGAKIGVNLRWIQVGCSAKE